MMSYFLPAFSLLILHRSIYTGAASCTITVSQLCVLSSMFNLLDPSDLTSNNIELIVLLVYCFRL